MKKFKESKPVKGIATVVKVGATIGGAAVVGFLLKKTDIGDIKGLKKIFIPLGVFGLAHAAGNLAGAAAKDEVLGYAEIADDVAELITGEDDDEEFDEDEFEPEEEEIEEA